MMRIVLSDKKGLSLVEVMIALVVLLLVVLALMQTALLSIDANMNNLLRDEAVNIAEQHIIAIRNTPFDSVTATGYVADAPTPETKAFRNFALPGGYAIRRQVTDLGLDNKQVDIEVTWTWKGESYTHIINSILRRPS
ncbi:MAG: hypothetical protein A2X59_06775 [Nitrospirae bacterium GWC2_42_7]|nr:MAG: hypothetical protein A2X59_06775 [Nitrospirae bacterium GWC2_42_7]